VFLCEKCINQYDVFAPLETCLRSRGPCEGCGKPVICYDLPHGCPSRKAGIRPIRTKKIERATNEIIKFDETEYCLIELPKSHACYIRIDGMKNYILISGSCHVVNVLSGDSLIKGASTHGEFHTSSPKVNQNE